MSSLETVRLALRDWDWVSTLLLGQVDLEPVRAAGVDLEVAAVDTLPDLAAGEFAAGETSLSRLVQARAAGEGAVRGFPVVLMQAFRQRCILVRADDDRSTERDLDGSRIGVTGWIDSGNTWTRALLTDAGVGLDRVRWIAGRLTGDHPVQDRLAGHGRAGWIETDPDERPLIDLLTGGELDAVMTPFMPPGFFTPRPVLRTLHRDLRAAEAAWYARHQMVPGMHLLGIRADLVARRPELPAALATVLDAARALWRAKRMKYLDASTWLAADLADEARLLASDWNASDRDRQAPMIETFIGHQRQQGLLSTVVEVDDVLDPLDPLARAA